MTELQKRAKALYTPPFRWDALGSYIWDAKCNMVADMTDGELRVRGWGRIQKMPESEALQDAVDEQLQKVFVEGMSGEQVAVKLTERWQEEW